MVLIFTRSLSAIIALIGAIVFTRLEWNDFFLWSLGIIRGSVSGIENLESFKSEGGIIVFNHPTFFDHSVLIQATNSLLRFLVKEAYVSIFPLNILTNKLGCISVDKGNTITKLKKTLGTKGNLIAISPSGGFSFNDQTKLSTFKTGAFVVSDRILPIVISYFPFERWHDNQSMMSAIYKRLSGGFIQYHVAILPCMTKKEEESPEVFAGRVKEQMELALCKNNQLQMPPLDERPNLILLLSSLLFGICAYFTYLSSRYFHSYGMLIVFLTSVWYHSTGSISAKFVDTFSNFTLGVLFGLHGLWKGNYIICLYAVIALIGYLTFKSQIGHLIGVHIPVVLGFSTFMF